MKILVVGSGGREHAIVDTIARSAGAARIFCAPGNAGIREQAELVPIAADDVWALVELARTEHIDLTFVGPEVPLSKGIVDIFGRHGLRFVGPTAEQA
jgi:phosphoribosylamine--glycine ligase